MRVDKEGNRIRCEPDEQGYISVSAGDTLMFEDPRHSDRFVAVNSLVFFTAGVPLKVQLGDNEKYPLFIGANERRGVEPAAWDFAKNPADIVVLNLGTNDVNPIRFSPDFGSIEAKEVWFQNRYREFIADIRKLNGPDTLIVCALGSMDYYLYDRIQAAVAQYKQATGDEKVATFKFIGINLIMEGFGAMGHPSAKTQERMGHELAYHLKELVG